MGREAQLDLLADGSQGCLKLKKCFGLVLAQLLGRESWQQCPEGFQLDPQLTSLPMKGLAATKHPSSFPYDQG